MDTFPTIAEIARHCKVSTYTVSLALRNSTRVAASTRQRVQKEAHELGYRPNPLINALMASVRNRRNRPTGDVLGFIVSREKATHPGQLDHQARMFKGASKRAQEFGYRAEIIRLSSVAGRGNRLQQVLDARGIHGVIIAPVSGHDFKINLDWSRLACATIGYSFSEVPVHRVTHNHFRSMRMVLDNCDARGWKRPGILLSQHALEAVDQGFLAGYLTGIYGRHHGIPVSPLLYADDTFNRKTLLDWMKKHRVDAVISLRHDTHDWLVAAGYKIGHDIGLIMLDCNETDEEISGINQRQSDIGAAAIELLANTMQNSEYGIPKLPRIVGLDGIWHEGRTLPVREKSPAQKHPKDS
jgi:DNA-binding LacI/PurR family transcriptional regulator